MAAPKYRVGQSVAVVGNAPGQPKPPGSFKIVRIMPAERGVQQYRIKSDLDGHERMVIEADIA